MHRQDACARRRPLTVFAGSGPFRNTSWTSAVAKGLIAGLGPQGDLFGLQFLVGHIPKA
jgi:3-dehydroquinate dehydratase